MSGFPALRWGEQGRMPVPASLSAIADVDDDVWQGIIDKLCRLDESCPPMLLRRPALGAVDGDIGAAATQTGPAASVSAAALTEEALSGGPDGSALRGELRPALTWGLASAIM